MTALLEDRMADVAPARAANWLLFAVTGFVAVFDGCLSVTTLYDLWYDTVMSRASPKVALSPK